MTFSIRESSSGREFGPFRGIELSPVSWHEIDTLDADTQKTAGQIRLCANPRIEAIMDLVGFGFLIVLAPLVVYAVAFWHGIADRAVLARHAPAPKLKRSHHKKRRAF
jgi:hypothetical protein